MYLKTFFTTYAYTLRKILGVALIVYLALTVKVDLIGETDEVVQFDYLAEKEIHGTASLEFCQSYQQGKYIDNPLHIILEELCEGEDIDHFTIEEPTVSKENFTALCNQSPLLCKKTLFNGNFSDPEKADYFGQVDTLVNDIDTIAKRGTTLIEVFTQILINQSKGDRRGSSTWTKLTMNLGGLKYDNEFFQVLTHEVGHIMDLGALQGKSQTKHQLFTEFGKTVFTIDDPSLEYYHYSRQSETIRKSGVNKKDFCSGYGMTDPFEDFAECHNLYLNHQNVFQWLAQQNSSLRNKYNYFANLYGGNYFSDSSLKREQIKTDRRAWDTTRIEE